METKIVAVGARHIIVVGIITNVGVVEWSRYVRHAEHVAPVRYSFHSEMLRTALRMTSLGVTARRASTPPVLSKVAILNRHCVEGLSMTLLASIDALRILNFEF